jgi:glycosyltransferase involved in cell wall biosynthesis
MKIVYRLANVFVLPSKSETWGLSVNEALASGIPVLVSDRCGCAADLVVDGVNGFIFKSNDLYSLARCIQKYLLNDAYRGLKLNTSNSIKTYTFQSFHLSLTKLLSDK